MVIRFEKVVKPSVKSSASTTRWWAVFASWSTPRSSLRKATCDNATRESQWGHEVAKSQGAGVSIVKKQKSASQAPKKKEDKCLVVDLLIQTPLSTSLLLAQEAPLPLFKDTRSHLFAAIFRCDLDFCGLFETIFTFLHFFFYIFGCWLLCSLSVLASAAAVDYEENTNIFRF